MILNQLTCIAAGIKELVALGNNAPDYTGLLDSIIALLTELEADTTAIETTLTDIKTDTSTMVTTLSDVLTQVTAINENTDEVEGLLQQLITLAVRDQSAPVAGDAFCAIVDGVPGVTVKPVALVDQHSLVHVTTLYYDEAMNPITGTVEVDDPCNCLSCDECGDVQACILFSGFDMYRGLLSVGDTTQFDIAVDGTVQSSVVHDYTTSADGTTVSSWYTPVIAAINALPNWSIAVEEDVAVTDEGKVTWQLEHTGTVAETLTITKTPNGDVLSFASDGAGTILGTSSDGGSGTPFGSDPFDHPACVAGDGAPVVPGPTISGFDVAVALGQDSKIDFNNPAFDDAFSEIGGAWVAADLVARLNDQVNFPAPSPYDTTVWQLHPTNPTVVQVASGPVPTTIDFVSLSISVPFTP
jgi:hypothetical protein